MSTTTVPAYGKTLQQAVVVRTNHMTAVPAHLRISLPVKRGEEDSALQTLKNPTVVLRQWKAADLRCQGMKQCFPTREKMILSARKHSHGVYRFLSHFSVYPGDE